MKRVYFILFSLFLFSLFSCSNSSDTIATMDIENTETEETTTNNSEETTTATTTTTGSNLKTISFVNNNNWNYYCSIDLADYFEIPANTTITKDFEAKKHSINYYSDNKEFNKPSSTYSYTSFKDYNTVTFGINNNPGSMSITNN